MKFLGKSWQRAAELVLLAVLAACGNLDTPGTKAAIEIPGVPTPTADTSVFSVSVGTIWESDTTNSVFGEQTCSVSQDDTDKNCPTISIPEARLYYGKLNIKVKVSDADKCAIMSFFPYYYRMSSAADFKPAGAYTNFSSLDCSAADTPVGCFSGAATKIVSSFKPGQNTGIYFLPAIESTKTWIVDSPNTLRGSLNYDMGLRWFANNLVDPEVGRLDYVASSLVDYTFICEDIYNDTQHSMTLKIAPDATAGDAADQYQHVIRW